MWGPHFHNRCMKNTGHPTKKFQNYKKINNPHMFHQKNHSSGQLSTDTISFKASQPTKAGDDISLIVSTKKKHFLSKVSEKYTLQKRANTPSDALKSQDIVINEVIETITTKNNHTNRTEPLHKAADKEDLLSLFDQYFDLMSTTSD